VLAQACPASPKLSVVFRRRNAGAGSAVEEADGASPGTSETAESPPAGPGTAYTPGKGRPTPKRSEAEKRRRGPYAPGDRRTGGRAGGKEGRARDRAERARKYEAMKRGEEWALAPRDKGPVKALTRDYVDSRRRISEYYMYILIVLMLALFVQSTALKAYLYPVVLLLAVVILIEGTTISRRVRKIAAERYPNESTRGITRYAIMRTLQIRRFRMPVPRVKPGDKI
jgi:Protein of unknown function (DUF3043)